MSEVLSPNALHEIWNQGGKDRYIALATLSRMAVAGNFDAQTIVRVIDAETQFQDEDRSQGPVRLGASIINRFQQP